MAFAGSHWLIIWNDFGGGDDREYEAWIVREHMNDRMGVPGFLRGRRYLGTSSPRYLNMYEVDGIGRLTEGAYLSSLNTPSPWTKKLMPQLTNFVRVVCRAIATRGDGVPGHLATFRVPTRTSADDEKPERVLEALVALPTVLGGSIGMTIPASSTIDTAEKRLRAGERAADAEIVIAIEAASPATLEEAMPEIEAIVTRELGNTTFRGTYALSLLLDQPTQR